MARIKSYRGFVVIGIAAAVIGAVRIAYEFFGPPLIIQYTPSEPKGVYWVELHPPEGYKRSDLVRLPVPTPFQKLVWVERQWVRHGDPLVKGVGALAGDEVCADDQVMKINGVVVGPIFTVDSLQRPMPVIRGCYTVSEGYFLPLSTYIEKSFDGRYIGEQPLSSITGKVHSVWTSSH